MQLTTICIVWQALGTCSCAGCSLVSATASHTPSRPWRHESRSTPLSRQTQRASSDHSWRSPRQKVGSRAIFYFSQAFPIIWGRRNGYEYLSSTLSCPIRPPSLTWVFPRATYWSSHVRFWFCLSSWLHTPHLWLWPKKSRWLRGT